MIKLKNRGLIKINGKDAIPFLNNILTRNVEIISQGDCGFAALLSPQGKFLFDIFVVKIEENSFFLDCNDTNELFSKLRMYKLRAEIEIENLSDSHNIYHSLEMPKDDDLISYIDPRCKELGYRIIANNTFQEGDFINYEILRIKNSIPDCARDLIRDKDFALEGLLEENGAIDFQKGCYIGQEMTSRMKRRGTLKQKLCSFEFIGNEPSFDTPIMAQDIEIGRTRTIAKNMGIALIRFDRLKLAQENNIKLIALDTEVLIKQANWIII